MKDNFEIKVIIVFTIITLFITIFAIIFNYEIYNLVKNIDNDIKIIIIICFILFFFGSINFFGDILENISNRRKK